MHALRPRRCSRFGGGALPVVELGRLAVPERAGGIGFFASVSGDPELDADDQQIAGRGSEPALFLLAGVFLDRSGTYEIGEFGGLASRAPRMTVLFSVAAFASLGLPGLSGFIAEFQIFTGSIAAVPASALALLGILIISAVFLWTLQRVFTGETRARAHDFTDLRSHEAWAVGPLLVLSLVIGLAPRPLLDVIEPAAHAVVAVLDR